MESTHENYSRLKDTVMGVGGLWTVLLAVVPCPGVGFETASQGVWNPTSVWFGGWTVWLVSFNCWQCTSPQPPVSYSSYRICGLRFGLFFVLSPPFLLGTPIIFPAPSSSTQKSFNITFVEQSVISIKHKTASKASFVLWAGCAFYCQTGLQNKQRLSSQFRYHISVVVISVSFTFAVEIKWKQPTEIHLDRYTIFVASDFFPLPFWEVVCVKAVILATH